MEPVNVSTVAEFKRLLKSRGITHLRGEFHTFAGGRSENNPQHPFFQTNAVKTVQSNSFTRLKEDGRESWCDYPAARFTVCRENFLSFPIDTDKPLDDTNRMTYSCWKD